MGKLHGERNELKLALKSVTMPMKRLTFSRHTSKFTCVRIMTCREVQDGCLEAPGCPSSTIKGPKPQVDKYTLIGASKREHLNSAWNWPGTSEALKEKLAKDQLGAKRNSPLQENR